MLSPEQVRAFNEEGYLIYRQPVLPETRFQALRDRFEELLNNLPQGRRPEEMDMPHLRDPGLFDWLLSDPVLDLVEPILGPDLTLFASHFICKPGGTGKRVPWHEDSAYWKDRLIPMKVCTVWLALDRSSTENGCMRVIPRTHFNGYSDYEPVDPEIHVFSSEIIRSQREDGKAVDLELEPNQCSLHDGKLMHSSEPNTSPLRRCAYTMRYIASDVRVKKNPDGSQQPVYLARGRALADNVYSDPSKENRSGMEVRRKYGIKGH